jgi:serine/threonine-protein kinase
LALQLCGALEAAHAAGVVHRDLKPANVLVVRDSDGRERVKLVDFGIAQLPGKADERLTGIDAIIGTPAYMSPEQLIGSGDVDGRADVYALGITMFECLTGEVPYVGNYPAVLMQACGDGPGRRLPAGVEPKIANVVERAMAKKRDERFGSAGELAQALRVAQPNAPRWTALLEPPARPETATQRRGFQRAPYVTPVSILFPHGATDGRSEDVSEGGLLVLTRHECEIGARATLRFAMPIEGRVASCDATARWVRSASANTAEGTRAVGFEFVDLGDELRASIQRYVSLMGNGADGVRAS